MDQGLEKDSLISEEMPERSRAARSGDAPNMDFLMDIPLEVTVELGRTRMMVRQLLKLKRNSLIELDREANEPVDILINNKPFAKGEVVIEGERIAIMITDIISPRERIQRLA